jgi:intracellular sulfur oxidation DsrE/DsrF family protein
VLDAYASLNVPASDVATAVVLYHGASIALAFDDAIWKALFGPAIPKLSQRVRADVAEYAHATANPFLSSSKPGATTVGSLIANGTLFFVCNHAVRGFAETLAPIAKRPAGSVYGELAAGLVPGATLVPAGVWAVGALQERGFTYLQTTM